MRKISKIIRNLATIPIVLYQHTFSPDHGFFAFLHPHGYCRFYPSCSEYSRQAILKYGLIKGTIKGILRIIRCNPWSDGGIDKP